MTDRAETPRTLNWPEYQLLDPIGLRPRLLASRSSCVVIDREDYDRVRQLERDLAAEREKIKAIREGHATADNIELVVLRADLAAERERNKELVADRERLDWLQHSLMGLPDYTPMDALFISPRWTSIRDAIDAARLAANKEGGT